MKYINSIISLAFIFSLFSCTKEINFDEEILNTQKNITIHVYKLPPEPGASTSGYEREIYIYGSHADFIDKINPIFHKTYAGLGRTNSILLDSINYDVLFLRAISWEIYWDLRWYRGTFYYEDSISIPNYNCDINMNLIREKWILEN